MRNLKRALSLGLTAAMISGLMVMGSSAVSYPDSDQIQNQTAVEILGEIGVMVGDDNGNFNPTQDVTRAEMAVIITRILYGNDLNVDQFKGMNLFTDVPAWAEGFVNLCASLDIVAGVGDGKFAPNETVTAAQAALMLSRALGYFQNNAEFGNDWALAAIRRATSAGIIGDDMVLAANEGLSRDNVAQMTFNTLTKAVPVQYNELLNVYYNENQGITYALTFNYLQTLGYTNFDLVYDNGDTTIYGRPATTWGIGSYRTTTSDKDSGSRYDEALDANGGLISSNVQILSRDEIITIANEPTYTYTDGTAEEDIYDDLGEAVCNDQRGQKAEDEYDWTVYVNGELQDVSDEDAIPAENEGDAYAYTGDGVQTEIYVDDADKTVTVVEINYYLGQVASVDEEEGTVSIRTVSNDADLDDRTFATTEFEEEDYVVFTIDQNEDEDFYICEMSAPETVDGTVTRVNGNNDSDNAYLFLDRENKYNYSDHMAYDLNDETVVQHPDLDKDYTLYLDPLGYVLAYSGDTTKSFLYVQDSDEELSDWEARVVLADGTDDVIMVDSDLDHGDRAAVNFDDEDKVEWATEAADLNAFPNWVDSTELDKWDTVRGKITDIDYQIWEYETNADGDLYTLTGRNTRYAADVEINNGKAYMQSERWTSNVSIDNSTIFVDVENNVVYTGYDEVPDVSNAYIAYVLENDNSRDIAEIVYIIDGDIYDANAIFFVLESADRDTEKYDGDFYFEFEDTKVDGHDRDGLFVSYDALINSGYLGGINSLDEDDSTADRDSKVTAEIKDELVGKIIEVRKSTDGTYVTEIRVHDDWDPAIAVSRTALDVAEDWFFSDNWNTSKYTADADTTYVIIDQQYNRAMTEITGYDVSEGGYGDIVAWVNEEPTTDRDGYATLVNVVKDDDQNAQLVYILRFQPEFYQREVTVELNGVEIDSQNLWWWSDSIHVTDVNAIAALNGAQANGSHLSYTVTYGDVTTGTATVPAADDTNGTYTILIPAASEDTVVNVTSDNANIEVNGNLTLDTTDVDDAIGAYSIDMDTTGSIRYGFQIDEIPDGYTVESITWDETIVRNGYVASNKEGKDASSSDIAVVLGRNIVYASAVGKFAATDTVTVYVTDAVVTLKPVEPVVDTWEITFNTADFSGYSFWLNDEAITPDVISRTQSSITVTETDKLEIAGVPGFAWNVSGVIQLDKNIYGTVDAGKEVMTITGVDHDFELKSPAAYLSALLAVNTDEYITLSGWEDVAGKAFEPIEEDGTYYVPTGATVNVEVADGGKYVLMPATVAGQLHCNTTDADASDTTATIDQAYNIYAVTEVQTLNNVTATYKNGASNVTLTVGTHSVARGTELTVTATSGTGVIEGNTFGKDLDGKYIVGKDAVVLSGAVELTLNKGVSATLGGKEIASGDYVAVGQNPTIAVEKSAGTYAIDLAGTGLKYVTDLSGKAVANANNLAVGSADIDLYAAVKVTYNTVDLAYMGDLNSLVTMTGATADYYVMSETTLYSKAMKSATTADGSLTLGHKDDYKTVEIGVVNVTLSNT